MTENTGSRGIWTPFWETGSSRPTRPAASLSSCGIRRRKIEEMEQKQREALGDIANGMRHFYGFDTSAGEEEQKAFYQTMTALVESRGLSAPATLESRAEARTSFMGMYGGFFFIGIFLGALFIMATVLIIYINRYPRDMRIGSALSSCRRWV